MTKAKGSHLPFRVVYDANRHSSNREKLQ